MAVGSLISKDRRRETMKTRVALLARLALFASLAAPAAWAQAPADRWTFAVTPYIWLPSADGNLRYGPPPVGGGTPNVSVDADSILGALDFALMLSGEARKGRWSIFTDLIYLDLSSDGSKVTSVDFNSGSGPVNVSNLSLDVGTDTKLKGTVWTLAGGYSVVYQPRSTMDLIAGFRYLDIKASTDWRLTAAVTGPAGAATFATVGG